MVKEKTTKRFINYLLLGISHKLQLSHVWGQPILLQIEPTSYCNSKCVMCPTIYAGMINRIVPKPRHMLFEEFKRIIAKFPYCSAICLYGFGEPLLNPYIVKMIKLCKEKGVYVSLTTNASVLSKAVGKKLILSGLDDIWFSIDGATAQTFESIRRGTKFSMVLKNIKQFVELKNELNSKKPKLKVRAIVSDANFHEIPELLNLIKSIGLKEITLRDGDFSGTPLNKVSEGQLSALLKHKSYGESLGLKVELLFPHLPPLNDRKRIRCWKLWKSVYITVDGWVTSCCRLPSEKPINYDNILKQDFKDIWNNKQYRHSRMMLRNSMPDFCKSCVSGTLQPAFKL